uniref:Mevalonate kinase n=1 Tax=Plectus sambesii TaxID=2011161 RepID=A0A914VXC4_9BILA
MAALMREDWGAGCGWRLAPPKSIVRATWAWRTPTNGRASAVATSPIDLAETWTLYQSAAAPSVGESPSTEEEVGIASASCERADPAAARRSRHHHLLLLLVVRGSVFTIYGARPFLRADRPRQAARTMAADGGGASGTSKALYISAPGKIILFGEHAVVYGRTAVAGSIDLRTYVSLFTSDDGRIYLSLPDLGVEKTWMLKDLLKAGDKLAECGVDEGAPPSLEVIVPVARKLSGSCEEQCGVQHLAILAFWYLLLGVAQRKRDLRAVKVTVRFKLPSCVGLGSSGAGGPLACKDTSRRFPSTDDGTLTWEDSHLDMIRKWSAAAESLIHGRASGLDAAVCTYGGVASFKPGTRIQHLRNLPDLRVILVNSKVERNTSRMVQTVKERLKKFPGVVDGIFNAMDAISREATVILNRPEGEQISPATASTPK